MYEQNTINRQFGVDKRFCIRCSSCSSLAPNNFKVKVDGSEVVKQPANKDELKACLAALTTCPASVISEKDDEVD